jgi:Protein of unknown function (DUF1699)
MQRVQLIEGDVWGHRKDINEYFDISSSVFERIKEMKLEGKSAEDIKAKISRESRLSPQMVTYIMTKEIPD